MPIRVLALDLERTLLSDALHREPRPGLYDFLLFCCDRFERVVLFTSVNKPQALAALQECANQGHVPQEFMDRLEYVEWEGMYKDLRFVPNATTSEVLIVDDDGGWIRADQQQQWIGIAEYDPYLVKGEDQEFVRVRRVLEERIQHAA
jgi:hypothetical protein